jgi:integrase
LSVNPPNPVLTYDKAYRNFVNSCKPPKTRKEYVTVFSYYVNYLGLHSYTKAKSEQDYDSLVKQDPKIIQENIIDFVTFCKARKGLSYATIHSYVCAIKHFYDQNDIGNLINWHKVKKFLPEHETVAEDQPYTHQEIARLLEKAYPLDKAIILLMCSSGLRVGAISSLRIKDLTPIDKYQIYKVEVYKKSKSMYYTFCTPEARKSIDDYLQWRQRIGEHPLKPDAPLFRKSFEKTDPFRVNNPKPLATSTIQWMLHGLLIETGIRELQPTTEEEYATSKKHRSDRMQCHGLRKFFDTTATHAGMSPLYVDLLMGHSHDGDLKYRYFKPDEEDLLEGNGDSMPGYLYVIDALTIDESQRLRREVETLKIRKDQIDDLRDELDQIKKTIGQKTK